MDNAKTSPEWSYEFDVDELGDDVHALLIEANEEACKRLAQRFGVGAVARLSADLRLDPQQGGDVVHVSGSLSAKVVQDCVVTAEPVQSEVSEDFEAWYGRSGAAISLLKAKQKRDEAKGQSEFKMVDEREDPEKMVDGMIDLGELVAQNLSLAINPYPQAEGAVYENGDDQADDSHFSFKNPFAGLKDWKDKLSEDE